MKWIEVMKHYEINSHLGWVRNTLRGAEWVRNTLRGAEIALVASGSNAVLEAYSIRGGRIFFRSNSDRVVSALAAELSNYGIRITERTPEPL